MLQSLFQFRFPVRCESVSIQTATADISCDTDVAKQLHISPNGAPKKSAVKRRKTTVKKYVPTVCASGHVAGVMSMQHKNLKDRPESWVTRCPLLNPWVLITKPMDWYVRGSGKVTTKRQIESTTSSTFWDHDKDQAVNNAAQAPADYSSNDARRRSNKAEKLSARHFQSNCSIERELFQVCLKDRFHSTSSHTLGQGRQSDCLDLQAKFKQCQDDM